MKQKIKTAALTTPHKGEVRVWVVAHAGASGQPMRKGKVPLLSKPAEELLPKEPTFADAFNLENIRTYGYAGVTGGWCFLVW